MNGTQKPGSVIDLTNLGSNPTVLVLALKTALLNVNTPKIEIDLILREALQSGTVEHIIKTIIKYIESVTNEAGTISSIRDTIIGRAFDTDELL